MLDEPTNHLDMHSCDLLIEALNKYQGTYILVSHDRYFISKTANKIWEIDDHKIKEFKGGYEEWMAWKERMAKNEARSQKSDVGGRKSEVGGRKSEVRNQKSEVGGQKSEGNKRSKGSAQTSDLRPQTSDLRPQTSSINKDTKKELQKMQKQFQQLEEKIAALNIQKNELEASLSEPATYSDKTKFHTAETAYKKAAADLEQLNRDYESVFEKIMILEAK
jgi:ATP-binding cassette subfamily F protein 3